MLGEGIDSFLGYTILGKLEIISGIASITERKFE
jgi:hypothetical protein